MEFLIELVDLSWKHFSIRLTEYIIPFELLLSFFNPFRDLILVEKLHLLMIKIPLGMIFQDNYYIKSLKI